MKIMMVFDQFLYAKKYGGALKDSVCDRMEFFVEEMLPKETWKSAHTKFLVMYLLHSTS